MASFDQEDLLEADAAMGDDAVSLIPRLQLVQGQLLGFGLFLNIQEID